MEASAVGFFAIGIVPGAARISLLRIGIARNVVPILRMHDERACNCLVGNGVPVYGDRAGTVDRFRLEGLELVAVRRARPAILLSFLRFRVRCRGQGCTRGQREGHRQPRPEIESTHDRPPGIPACESGRRSLADRPAGVSHRTWSQPSVRQSIVKMPPGMASQQCEAGLANVAGPATQATADRMRRPRSRL